MLMRLATCLLAILCPVSAQQAAQLLREAIAAHEKGDLSTAVSDYEAVLRLRPDLNQARINLGAALGEMGRFDEAIDVYSVALKRDPKNTKVQLNLAQAYFRKGDAPAAIHLLEPLHSADQSNIRVTMLLADSVMRTGDSKRASALLEPVEREHPDNPDVTYLLSMALIRSGRAQEGLPLAKRVAKEAKSADAYLLAGSTEFGLGQFSSAREDLEEAIKLNPALPGALSFAALARDKTGDEPGAKKAFEQALALNPDDFDSNLHLAAILYRERDLDAARPHLERALKLQPSSAMAQYAMALVDAAQGRTEQSVSALETIVQKSPNWVEPRVKLTSLYYKLRRQADAQRERAVVDRLIAEHRDQHASFEN